jgi:cytochrome c oxidase cbb3-type subunit 1
MMLIPLLAVVINWHMTLKGQDQKLAPHSVLPFIKFGAFCYVVGSLLQILGAASAPGAPPGPPQDASEAMQSTFALVSGLGGQIASVTRFTHYGPGVTALFLFGFLGMVAAGGIYYIVPKLTQCEWPSAQLIKFHFRCGAAGVVFVATALVLAGLRQGAAVNNSSVPFLETVRSTIPFLGMSTLGMLLLLAGGLALGLNLARLLMHCRCSDCCPSVARAGV